jgi:hypothetical protein
MTTLKKHLIVRKIIKDNIDKNGNFKKVGRKPKFSDTEIIALYLANEILFLDSENNLFIKLNTEYKKEFPIYILW